MCAVLRAAGLGYAQPSATITLKSGQVISADLIALAASGYSVRAQGKTPHLHRNRHDSAEP